MIQVNILFITINFFVDYFVLKINIFLLKYATFCIKYSIIAILSSHNATKYFVHKYKQVANICIRNERG